MFFKIIYVITLITLCSGAPPLHPQAKSNEATYSHSFIREDVPLSYKYSATHHYTPKKAEDTLKREEDILKRNEDFPRRQEVSYHVHSAYNSPFNPLSNRTIQFAPINHPIALPSNSGENTYPSTPVLYTSIVSNPVTEYGKFELTENSAESTLHLEPKRIPNKAKNISPSTYRPHMNHDVKMLHSHHSHLRPKVYKTLHMQPLATTAVTPKLEMADLHHLAIFHQLQQQQDQQPKYIDPTTTTENPKLSHVLNLGVRILPKQGIPFITMPHELSKNTPFQPIPRIAYHNKYNVVSEKLGGPQAHTRYHLNNPNKHLRFKPNVQHNISN